MLAGLALILAGAVFLTIGLLLPRVRAGIEHALSGFPPEMRGFAASFMPGVDRGLALLKIVPVASKGAAIGGCVFLAVGLFALVTGNAPLWLNALALLILIAAACACAGLYLTAKRFAPLVKQFLEIRSQLKQ